MILTKTVTVTLSNNRKYYKDRGYEFESSDKNIIVDVKHLPNGSRCEIDVVCDICGCEKNRTYAGYIKSYNNGNQYACSSKCSRDKVKQTNLELFGTEYAIQNKEIKEKVKQTNLEKYGVTCSLHNEKIKEKVKQTNLGRYGTEYSSQNEDVKEKSRNTCLERYGVEYSPQSEDVKEKIKKTWLENYGVNNPMKLESIREKGNNSKQEKYGDKNYNNRNKFKETCLDRYGVETPLQNEDILNKLKNTCLEKYGVEYSLQSEEVKKKIKETCLEKYGTEYATQNDEVKEKTRNTCLDRYGVEYGLQSEEVKAKIKETCLEKYGTYHTLFNDNVKNSRIDSIMKTTLEYYNNILDDSISIKSYDFNEFVMYHNTCDSEFNINIRNLYYRTKYIPKLVCTKCNPIDRNVSIIEEDLFKWVISLSNSDIIKNDRKILSGKELDIYIPDKNLAIEFNGVYWHSEKYKDKDYHLNKTIGCENRGIDLLHIFEDDWLFKQDIVKSIIRNKLGLIDNKIYARKCVIKEVGSADTRLFLDKNHIQGFSKSKYKLGLYYRDELVSLMTFGYRRTNSKKEFELIRFCNILNTNVIGAGSKLFKYFIKTYSNNVEESYLISYADISLFNGDLYNTLGFVKKHRTKPNYFWVVNGIRQHRFKYNKQKLVKEGFDPLLTEREIMYSRGYYRIFGSGQDRYEYHFI